MWCWPKHRSRIMISSISTHTCLWLQSTNDQRMIYKIDMPVNPENPDLAKTAISKQRVKKSWASKMVKHANVSKKEARGYRETQQQSKSRQHKKKGVEARGAAEPANHASLIHGRLLARWYEYHHAVERVVCPRMCKQNYGTSNISELHWIILNFPVSSTCPETNTSQS